MNLPTQIAVDALRCAALAGIAFAIGWPLGRGKPAPLRRACLLVPLLTPSPLIGRAAAPLALHLGGALLTAFYSALLVLKLAPLAALAREFFPSPLSPEAAHCARLIERTAVERAWFAVRAAGPLPWITLAAIFLLMFTDFALALALGVKTWAVILADAR